MPLKTGGKWERGGSQRTADVERQQDGYSAVLVRGVVCECPSFQDPSQTSLRFASFYRRHHFGARHRASSHRSRSYNPQTTYLHTNISNTDDNRTVRQPINPQSRVFVVPHELDGRASTPIAPPLNTARLAVSHGTLAWSFIPAFRASPSRGRLRPRHRIRRTRRRGRRRFAGPRPVPRRGC